MSRTSLALASLAVAAASAAVPAPAGALPVAPVVSLSDRYAPSEVVVPEGGKVQLVNGDHAQSHDLRSLDTIGGVPLFRSAMLSPGGTGEVVGVDALEPSVYPFYCSVHDYMTGNITVVAP